MEALFAVGIIVGVALIVKSIKVASVAMIILGSVCMTANLGNLLMRKD
jgi:hypothetical protein|nr:MAG TPA: hypothetical protein [Caudoviricetes sp.]